VLNRLSSDSKRRTQWLALGGLQEVIVFLEYFKVCRTWGGKVIYPLNEVLLLCLLAVLAGRRRSPALLHVMV
jgi:hypothetical protein